MLILGFFVGNSIRKEEGVGFTNGHGVRRDGKGGLDMVRLCDFALTMQKKEARDVLLR